MVLVREGGGEDENTITIVATRAVPPLVALLAPPAVGVNKQLRYEETLEWCARRLASTAVMAFARFSLSAMISIRRRRRCGGRICFRICGYDSTHP